MYKKTQRGTNGCKTAENRAEVQKSARGDNAGMLMFRLSSKQG